MYKQYYVYIMSSYSKRLYIGMTGDLHRRVAEHKQGLVEGFTKRYNLKMLVYVRKRQATFGLPLSGRSTSKDGGGAER